MSKPKEPPLRLPTARERLIDECIVTVVVGARVEHLPENANRRYGIPRTLCGKNGVWLKRLGWVAPTCAECGRRSEGTDQ